MSAKTKNTMIPDAETYRLLVDQLAMFTDASNQFAALDARKGELVKLRYFVGLSFEEASEVLGIAVPTAKQWWAYARAWLRVEMTNSGAGTPPGV